MMHRHFPQPRVGLLDRVGVKAAGAYSCVERLSLNYRGPLITVRRASDNATLDINTIALTGKLNREQLKAFCSGTSGYVSKLWDSSGNGRHLTQATTANQPRIVNAGTIDTTPGGRPVMVFSTSSLERNDALGLTGSPALTIGSCWSGQSDQKMPWTLGSSGGGTGSLVGLYTDYTASSRLDVNMLWHQGGDARHFTCAAATGFHSYTVQRPANVTAQDSSVTMRQNGVALTFAGNDGSNGTLNLSNQYLALGRATWAFSGVKLNFFCVINAVLAGNALTAFEAGMAAHA